MILLAVALGCAIPPPRSSQTRDSRPQTQPQPPAYRPTLSYTKPHWVDNEINAELHFEVKNTTANSLSYIQIHASFYDKNDEFVTSQEIYIDRWRGLGSGQRSSAVVMFDKNPKIKTVRLEFTCKGDDISEELNMDATEVQKL